MCFFSAYHAMKRSGTIKQFTHDTPVLGNEQVLLLHGLFASTLFVEALEVGLSPSHFRPTHNSVQMNLEFVRELNDHPAHDLHQLFEEGTATLADASGELTPTDVGTEGARGTATSTSVLELPSPDYTMSSAL